MKTIIIKKIRFALLLLFSLIISLNLSAQTMEEANSLYSQSRELVAEEKFKEAIEKLNECLKICEKIGEEADQLKQLVITGLPNVWYNYAKHLFDDGKVNKAIEAYEKTLDIAAEYNDIGIFTMTNSVLSQLYLKEGNDLFRAREFESALENLEKALTYDSTNTSTLILMAYCYRRLENRPMMVEYFKKVLEHGDENQRNTQQASESLMNHYMTTGARLLNARNIEDGIKYLDTALTYGQSGDLMYYYAVGFNAAQEYDKAIFAAEQAIELDPNNRENLAKYNFEIGTAYYGKNNNTKACEYYKKADFGRTSMRVKPLLESLNCN